MTDGGLRAAHALHLAFDRSVGGATGDFLAGLARGEIWGGRGSDGQVTVPPRDGATPVQVGEQGAVRRWSWVPRPTGDQPLPHPFAYALIELDGADTALLHVLDVDDETALREGLRVRADWRPDRSGSVLDIRAFVPDDGGHPGTPRPPVEALRVRSDRTMAYEFEPGLVLSGFYRALAEGRILGGRCERCQQVYAPPHHRCPACGAGPMTELELPPTGAVRAMTVVHLPVPGSDIEVPFAWARIHLDGADVSFPHVLGGAPLDELHVGQRVEAEWVDDSERPASWEAIRHFRPVRP